MPIRDFFLECVLPMVILISVCLFAGCSSAKTALTVEYNTPLAHQSYGQGKVVLSITK